MRVKGLTWLTAPDTPIPDSDGEIRGDFLTRYVFAAGWVNDKEVLDVGCGLGYGAAALADAGARSVLATDISRQVVRAGRRLYSRPNLRFDVCEGLHPDVLAAGIDVITAFEVIEHMHDPAEFLSQAARALRPDGMLLISTPNATVTSHDGFENPFHDHEYLPDELVALLEQYLPTVKLYGVRRKRDLPPLELGYGAVRDTVSKAIWRVAGRKELRRVTRAMLNALPRYAGGWRLPWAVTPAEPWTEYEVTDTGIDDAGDLLAVCRKRPPR